MEQAADLVVGDHVDFWTHYVMAEVDPAVEARTHGGGGSGGEDAGHERRMRALGLSRR